MKLVFLFLYSTLLFSQQSQYKFERMIGDYNGVAYNGNSILCYGQYGIITYSNDLGETWGQINIGDENEIVKVINIKEKFIGFTKHKIIQSTNNGLFWNFKSEAFDDTIKDVKEFNNDYYILTDKAIYKTDHNFNDINIILRSDKYGEFNEFVLNNEYYYIVSNYNALLRFDKSLNFIDSTTFENKRIVDGVEIIIQSNLIFSGLIQINDEIYLCRHNSTNNTLHNSNQFNINTIYKSSNKGTTWYEYDSLYKTLNLHNIDNKLSYIGYEMIANRSTSSFNFAPGKLLYNQYDTNDVVRQINITDAEKDYRYLFGTHYDLYPTFKDLKRINDTTLITVGANKFIAISRNNGANWEILNYYNAYVDHRFGIELNYPLFVNDSIIFRIQNSSLLNTTRIDTFKFDRSQLHPPILKSLNAGVTFQPQYKRLFQTNMTYDLNMINFVNGNGMIMYNYIDRLVPNNLTKSKTYVMKTNDYGDTYHYDSLGFDFQPYKAMFHNVVNNDNIGIACFKKFNYTVSNENIYTFYKFDNNLNFIDSCSLEDYFLYYIVSNVDNQLYAYARKQVSEKIYKNVLINSNDFGCTWDEINIELPFNMSSDVSRNVFYDNNQIYFSVKGNNIDINKIYRYNLLLNVIDSLQVDPISNNDLRKAFFIYNRKLFYVDVDSRYIFEMSTEGLFVVLDTIKLPAYFKNKKGDYSQLWIYDIYSSYNSLYICTYDIDYTVKIQLNTYNKSNIIKVTLNPTPTTSVENQVESPTYLYTYPAYPNPARNHVRAMVYWDLRYDINKADIEVYDVMGVRVSGKENISIANATAYNGEIVWDCGSVPEGVYFIKITHGTSTKTVKVAVVR